MSSLERRGVHRPPVRSPVGRNDTLPWIGIRLRFPTKKKSLVGISLDVTAKQPDVGLVEQKKIAVNEWVGGPVRSRWLLRFGKG
jgi:hypothetical protein